MRLWLYAALIDNCIIERLRPCVECDGCRGWRGIPVMATFSRAYSDRRRAWVAFSSMYLNAVSLYSLHYLISWRLGPCGSCMLLWPPKNYWLIVQQTRIVSFKNRECKVVNHFFDVKITKRKCWIAVISVFTIANSNRNENHVGFNGGWTVLCRKTGADWNVLRSHVCYPIIIKLYRSW